MQRTDDTRLASRRLAVRQLGLALAAATVFAALDLRHASAVDSDPWAALRAGAIVLFRHASAPGTGDPENFRLGNCSTQRNLGDEGRAQARRIGERFAREQVTISAVLSSEWCRTIETAELAFPGKVKPEAAFNSFFDDRRQVGERTAGARAILAAWRGPGTLVVVTHQVNITALFDIVPAEGEGIVVRADGGKLTVIARIKP